MTKPKKEEAGPAELAEKPKLHPLMIQFEACVIEFDAAKDSNDRQTELLALDCSMVERCSPQTQPEQRHLNINREVLIS